MAQYTHEREQKLVISWKTCLQLVFLITIYIHTENARFEHIETIKFNE